ncbi:MAG: hypothetical protein IJP31_00885 [Lachnospiraceae bacterium]|nr:hypothetical protein [Lachnospiraceae bacterium]
MKNTLKKRSFELLVVSFLFTLLIFSDETMTLAGTGLLIWYQKMIPSLFPFMVLSGFLVKSGLANRFSRYLRPLLGLFFPLPDSMLYAIFMGFLCGFPMGAKVVADLLESRQISPRQGEYLLAFCNNIGPLYMTGYVLPLFNPEDPIRLLFIFYGVPLLYGCFLQFSSAYKKSILASSMNSYSFMNRDHFSSTRHEAHGEKVPPSGNYLLSFREALENALTQITLLGGCMVFFNCLQIYPRMIKMVLPVGIQQLYEDYFFAPLCSLLEIGGGLKLMAEQAAGSIASGQENGSFPLFPALLTLGGLSCIMQTLFIIKGTGLSIGNYLKHKLVHVSLILLLSFLWS